MAFETLWYTPNFVCEWERESGNEDEKEKKRDDEAKSWFFAKENRIM